MAGGHRLLVVLRELVSLEDTETALTDQGRCAPHGRTRTPGTFLRGPSWRAGSCWHGPRPLPLVTRSSASPGQGGRPRGGYHPHLMLREGRANTARGAAHSSVGRVPSRYGPTAGSTLMAWYPSAARWMSAFSPPPAQEPHRGDTRRERRPKPCSEPVH